MKESIHRHDITDKVWALLEPYLPGREGTWGGRAYDNRRFINAVFWILRTGAPWRDLPASYGGYGAIPTVGLSVGEIKEYGRSCLKRLWIPLITSGL
jgi:transposase